MPSSFHPINETDSGQDVLPRTTAADEDRKPPKPLLDARADYDAFLRERKAPGHFLRVNSPTGPIRRQDANGISSKQRAVIQEHYRWDDAERRWTMKNGGRIVTEEELYDVILSHQRVIENQANDALYDYMKTRFEGVHMKDVRKAYALWQKHNLGSADRGDDTLWGGPAATIGEKVPTKFLTLHPDLISVPHEDPLMTPDDSDSASGSESASAYAPERNTTPKHETRHPLSTSSLSYTFHPHKSHTLLVGTSSNDGKDAWLSLIERPGRSSSYRSNFYDHRGVKHTEDQLNVVWHDEFKYSRFSESDKDKHYQKRMQRRHIFEILKGLELQDTVQVEPSGQLPKNSATRLPRQGVVDGTPEAASDVGPGLNTASSNRRKSSRRKSLVVPRKLLSDSTDDDRPLRAAKRPRRTTMPVGPVATPTHDSSSEVEILSTRTVRPECTHEKTSTTKITTNLPTSAIAATTLLVSASNQPALAPVYVPFRKCTTHEKLFETLDFLFETLITMCNLKNKAACDFNAVFVTYTWNKKTQLIRRGSDDDWASFLRILETAWKKESGAFEEDGCEIGLLVHVNG